MSCAMSPVLLVLLVLLLAAVGALFSPQVGEDTFHLHHAQDSLRSVHFLGSENATDLAGIQLPAEDSGSGKILSRRRRYVVFPKGSSIQFVYCLTVRGYIPLTRIFTVGLTLGLAWQLPTETHQLYLQRRSAGRDPDREHRARLFGQLQAFLTARGLHGEHCVLRTVCEATQPASTKGTFMEEVFRVLFTLPPQSSDDSFSSWERARHNGTDCQLRFPRCSSIIDIPMHPPTQ